MAQWADYSWARPDVSKYAGALRYLETGSSRPDLTLSEVQSLHASGKRVGLIWETSAAAAGEGYTRGVDHAKRANAAADALGAPAGAAIFYTVDSSGLTPDLVKPYFDGVLSVAGRPEGIYGSYRIVEWAHSYGIRWCWQTLAWSGGSWDATTKSIVGANVSAHANIVQRYFLGDLDVNDEYLAFPTWGPGGEDDLMALPTASTPGYTTFRGRVCCVCLAAWLPVYEQMLLKAGVIKYNIDIWQLTGAASASAGTHSQGGVADLFQYTDTAIRIARDMGATAAWRRTTAQGFTRDHQHLVLRGCPHNSPAFYQVTAQDRGYNGLGVGPAGSAYAGMSGYGGKDYHPDAAVTRTWSQGIAWAKAQLEPPKEWWEMAIPDTEVAKIANAVAAILIDHPDPVRRAEGEKIAWKVSAWSANQYSWLTFVNSQKILAALGEDQVDETQIAAELARLMGPSLVAAVTQALVDNADVVIDPVVAAALAEAVVKNIGTALSGS